MLFGASLSAQKIDGLLGGVVKHRGFVGGIDGAEGDAVDAAGQQIVDHAFLCRRRWSPRISEIHIDIRIFLGGLVAAGAADRPEIGGVVGDERQLPFFAAGAGLLADWAELSLLLQPAAHVSASQDESETCEILDHGGSSSKMVRKWYHAVTAIPAGCNRK